MKICFLSGCISSTGGTERVGIHIANELSKKGHFITILSMTGNENAFFKVDKNIEVTSLHMEKYKNAFIRKAMRYIKLFKLLKKKKFDIVISIDVIYSLYLIPIKKILKFKLVSWEHFNCHNNNGVKLRDKARKKSAKYADAIITLTNRDKLEYFKLFKIKTLCDYILNPIISLYDDSIDKENIVLACGRLCYIKNYQELLEIWNMAKGYTNGWKLVICGEGNDREELEHIIEKYNLDNVELPGNIKDMKKMYNSAKIMVMTSRNEGLPMVLLEAQSCGLPIISYDCYTGPSEIISDKSGFLIEYGNREEFKNALIKLINNNDIQKEMSINALEESKRYDIDLIVKKWEEVLDKISKK